MILRRFIYYCGKFYTDTINQTVFTKEFVKLVWGKWKLFRATLREKENLFRYRALFEGNLLRFARARAHDAKIVRSRDAQCNTKELP